jgi:hypothetical protein
MWKNVTDIAKTAAAFLQYGKAPPNISPEKSKEIEDMSHFSSKKFFIVFSSIFILAFFYFSSVFVLFILPHHDPIIVGFTTLFSKTIEILSIIIAAYLGVQAFVDLKYNSASSTSLTGSTTSKTEKKIEEATVKFENLYKDDKSYAPISWIESQPYE